MITTATIDARPARQRVTVAPVGAVATAADLRAHLRLDDTSQDAMLDRLIAVATDQAERWCGIAILPQTRAATWDAPDLRQGDGFDHGRTPSAWPAVLPLPIRPVTAVTALHVIGEDGSATLVDAGIYIVDADSDRICLRDGQTWPVVTRRIGALRATITCGFAIVPPALVQAVLMIAAHLYSNRGDCADACTACGADHLLAAWRRVEV